MNDPIVFSISAYGLAIVISFLVAALIKGVVVLLPLLERRGKSPARAATAAAPAAIPPEHIAAIAAAVAAFTGARHIIHIEDRGRATTWAAEGRMMHQTSHSVGHTPQH